MQISKIAWIVLCCLIVPGLPVHADDLDLLRQLGETTEETFLEGLEETEDDVDLAGAAESGLDGSLASLTDEADQDESSAGTIPYTVNGYLKPIINWNRSAYSDELWVQYQQLAGYGHSIPDEQTESGYTYAGARAQVSLEAYLGDRARLFSAINLDYDMAEQISSEDHEATTEENQDTQTASVRMVESFVELYEGSRTWKVGTQLVTWSFMEGYEVPTDRLNARDNTYVTSEYEDTKLASSGIFLKQEIGDSAIEVAFIPVGKVNINPTFTEYLFPGGSETREAKAENSKWATRLVGSLSKLDVAISYVDGTDPQSDTALLDSSGDEMEYDPSSSLSQLLTDMNEHNRAKRVYHRLKSVGLDLQLGLSSWIPKLSAVQYVTKDEDGDDPFIKNSWSQYLLGGEFKLGSATLNLYAGRQTVENYREENPLDLKTNYLNGQRREITNIVSGSFDIDFLTGNALKFNMMFAGYWDEESEPVESKVKAYLKYKITNGLEIYFAVSHIDVEGTRLADYQAEIKYSI